MLPDQEFFSERMSTLQDNPQATSEFQVEV